METTLEPENLQVVLDENITKKTMFVSNIMVQKPATTSGENGNGNHEEIVTEKFVIPEPEIETYHSPKEPNACDIGGG